MTVSVRFLGSGDAFGSGGRLHTCFHLSGADETMLIDCGATSLQALKRQGIDPRSVDSVALSHLHGDHFGGVPWLILNCRFTHRSTPLVVAGPAGTEDRVQTAFEALYPGALRAELPFELRFLEYDERAPALLPSATVTPVAVIHQSGAPSYGLRVQYGGRVISYSGDTEWTDSLVELARGADLFICECNFYDGSIPGHLDFRTLQPKLREFDCRRLIVTHMGEQMLQRVDGLDLEAAFDGLVVDLD
jgi:ribonuclease BN (tRNA processing enzyme)